MQRQIFGEETYMYKAKQLVEQLFESILPVDGRTNVKFLRFSTHPEYERCTAPLPFNDHEIPPWMHPRRCRYDNERTTLLSPDGGFPGISIGTFPGSIPRGNPVFSGSIPRGNMKIYNEWTCRGGSTALWASVYEVKQSIY